MEQRILEQRSRALKEFIYLPLFYMIPDEIAMTRKLDRFPRDPYVIATDPYWREFYQSKWFQVTLMDTWGWMMWQCLGIRGGVDNYSKNDPFVIMTFTLPMWAWLLAEQGITTDLLAAYPAGAEVPFLTMEQAAHNCDQFAKQFWHHPTLKMREVFEIVKTHRDHKDYSGMSSHVKEDFRRQFYHSRNQTQVEPITDENDEIIYAPSYQNDFAEVETRMWFDSFLKRLNDKDKQIIKLLEMGYTQKEIGKMLGYSNHSGVNKRIKYIKHEFQKFRSEENEHR